MKYLHLNTFILSLVAPIVGAHYLKGDASNLLEEKHNLRGADVGKITSAASRLKSEFVGVTETERTRGSVCPAGKQEYVKPNGQIVCKSVVSDNFHCKPDEEELLYRDGTIMCRTTHRNQGQIINVEHCLTGEEEVIHADGSFSCRKMKNGRVVAKKGPRKERITVDCGPNETKVVKQNGDQICRKNKSTSTTVVSYDDDYYLIEPAKETQRVRIVDDDDDGIVVVMEDDMVIVPVPVPVPVPAPIPVHVDPIPVIPVHVEPAPYIIPATGGCDVDGMGPTQAVAGNGNLLYGSDCTSQKSSCMPPMTCQHVGNCLWQCKT